MAFFEFNSEISGYRTSPGDYINGIFVPGPSSNISIQTSIQPSSDKEIKLLPEGRRTDSAWTLRSTDPIIEGDVFTIYGEEHEVLRVQDWQNGIIPHYLGVAVRLQT